MVLMEGKLIALQLVMVLFLSVLCGSCVSDKVRKYNAYI